MLKKHLFALPIAVLALAACGDDEEVTTAPDEAPTEQEQNNDEITSGTDAPFHFAKFSFEAQYSATESIDGDYSNESTGVEASYENDKTGEKLNGDEAFSYFEPMFESFTFDASTAETDVINEVIAAFELDDNYEELEIDVTFDDGTEKEYRSTKQ